jgi:hypothetical protein
MATTDPWAGFFRNDFRGYTRMTPRSPSLEGAALGQVSSGLESLISNYNQAYQSALQANEQRYQQMLDIADQTTGQRAADIRSAYGAQQSSALQRLGRLGLGNTTISPTLRMGIQREQQAALDRSADQMQQTRLGIMERRTDEYPSMAPLQALAGSIGSAYGASAQPLLAQALGQLSQTSGASPTQRPVPAHVAAAQARQSRIRSRY